MTEPELLELFELGCEMRADEAEQLRASIRLCARLNSHPKPLCEFCDQREYAQAWPDGAVLALLCLKCARENGLLDEPREPEVAA